MIQWQCQQPVYFNNTEAATLLYVCFCLRMSIYCTVCFCYQSTPYRRFHQPYVTIKDVRFSSPLKNNWTTPAWEGRLSWESGLKVRLTIIVHILLQFCQRVLTTRLLRDYCKKTCLLSRIEFTVWDSCWRTLNGVPLRAQSGSPVWETWLWVLTASPPRESSLKKILPKKSCM